LWGDVAELGDIIIGKRPGRKSPDDITVFHESKGGLDVAFTAWADAEARRLGLGRDTGGRCPKSTSMLSTDGTIVTPARGDE
jgi:hypothetical protein